MDINGSVIGSCLVDCQNMLIGAHMYCCVPFLSCLQQLGMRDHLKKKIEGHDEKMKKYKVRHCSGSGNGVCVPVVMCMLLHSSSMGCNMTIKY